MSTSEVPSLDQIVDEESLRDALMRCAAHPPEPMLPDHLTWGHGIAGNLALKLDGSPLAPALVAIVDELLASAGVNCMWLGVTLADPQTVGLAALKHARLLMSTKLQDPDSRHPMSPWTLASPPLDSLWHQVVGAGRVPWTPDLRQDLRTSQSNVLLGVAMVQDRAWALAQLDELLADDPSTTSNFASAVIYHLNRDQAQAWREDLQHRQEQQGDAQKCLDVLDYYLSRDLLPQSGGPRPTPADTGAH